MGLDLDLDEGGFLGAVRRIGLSAPAADARIRRRVVLFGALIEPGPLGAAVAGRAALLAALAFRARLVLLLALAAVERPSTAPPRSREASQAGLPVSRSGSATSSRPCAGGRSPGTSNLIVAFWRRDLRRALRRSASATDSDFDNVFLTARSPASSDSSAFLIARSLAG